MNNMKWFEKVCEKQDLLVYTNAEQHNHATLMHCTGNVCERDSITGLTFGQSSNGSQHYKTLTGTNECHRPCSLNQC